VTPAAGLVLAGGAATRIGGDKALLPFADGTLLDAVIARAGDQVSTLALNVPRDREADYRARYPTHTVIVDDFAKGTGPLAGVIAGLDWLSALNGPQWLATFPCDTPFLPRDLVAQLMDGARDVPVFARDEARMHGVCALWPVACVQRLRERVEQGKLRSAVSAMEALGGETRLIRTPAHAFFNVNTRDELATAECLALSVVDPQTAPGISGVRT
jgi:molybdopterin-guanine dinucleotide biosynthesis protein A